MQAMTTDVTSDRLLTSLRELSLMFEKLTRATAKELGNIFAISFVNNKACWITATTFIARKG